MTKETEAVDRALNSMGTQIAPDLLEVGDVIAYTSHYGESIFTLTVSNPEFFKDHRRIHLIHRPEPVHPFSDSPGVVLADCRGKVRAVRTDYRVEDGGKWVTDGNWSSYDNTLDWFEDRAGAQVLFDPNPPKKVTE